MAPPRVDWMRPPGSTGYGHPESTSLAVVRASLVTLLVVLALPAGAAAKSCSAAYTHAVIGGAQKCLHAGEYCAVRLKRQYPRYGFACEHVRGTYRLEAR
jgi:hypothetical protein